MFILHPSLDEEAFKANVEKFKGVIENGGGVIENVDFWGKRKLAYEINKVGEGYYTLVHFTAGPELPKELDRVFRITFNDNGSEEFGKTQSFNQGTYGEDITPVDDGDIPF